MTFIFFLACSPGPNRNLICPRNIKLNWNGLINAVHKYFEFYTLITMTSLQPTQAQGL